jgi:probable phosphoglycerate mutase
MSTIYLLRHGQTEWNREGRLQGRLDSPLTEQGRRQAAAMGEILFCELGAEPDALLLSSPQPRALATAAIVAQWLGLAVQHEPQLVELTMGSWDGMTRDEVEASWPDALHRAGPRNWHLFSPDGETLDAIRARVGGWLAAPRETTIVVSHGFTGRILRAMFLGLPDEAALEMDDPQDAVFRLRDGLVERVGG